MGHSEPLRARTVLIVDDSKTVRRIVAAAIARHADLRVVGEAGDGREAVELAGRLQPDVVVLDVHMPIMSGLAALPLIKGCSPQTRVVLFTQSTQDSSLELGEAVTGNAVDFVAKPTGVAGAEAAIQLLGTTLIPKLRAGHVRPSPPRAATTTARRRRLTPASAQPIEAVVVGSSTGGPVALENVVRALPAELGVPVFVVNHISAQFSGALAERLDRVGPLRVVEATRGALSEAGVVYIAPGGHHMVLEREADGVRIRFDRRSPVNSCRPSVDVLFESSAKAYGAAQLAVILTGMGQDGLDGCSRLGALGAGVIVQDKASSVIWGMPGSVAQADLADEVLPLDEIAERIGRWVATSRATTRKAQNV